MKFANFLIGIFILALSHNFYASENSFDSRLELVGESKTCISKNIISDDILEIGGAKAWQESAILLKADRSSSHTASEAEDMNTKLDVEKNKPNNVTIDLSNPPKEEEKKPQSTTEQRPKAIVKWPHPGSIHDATRNQIPRNPNVYHPVPIEIPAPNKLPIVTTESTIKPENTELTKSTSFNPINKTLIIGIALFFIIGIYSYLFIESKNEKHPNLLLGKLQKPNKPIRSITNIAFKDLPDIVPSVFNLP